MISVELPNSVSNHIIHGAFKTGIAASEWNIDGLLRSVWYLLHDSPARREDFLKISKSKKLPLKFCGTRWLEDAPVAERALLIWEDVCTYVKSLCSKPASQVPKVQSFQNLKVLVQDPLIPAKLQFFVNVAKTLQPYLETFQTEKPTFVSDALYNLLYGIMARFVKKDVLDGASTVLKLMEIDISKKENLVTAKNVGTGFAAKQTVQDVERQQKASARQILEFRSQSITSLQSVANKLIERCPLKYPVVRYLSCLDPRVMARDTGDAVDKMTKLLDKLIRLKQATAEQCDTALSEYKAFLRLVKTDALSQFREYDPVKSCRLDGFLAEYMTQPQFSTLWDIVKQMLILSHGQAMV